jgi:hypothetical protein
MQIASAQSQSTIASISISARIAATAARSHEIRPFDAVLLSDAVQLSLGNEIDSNYAQHVIESELGEIVAASSPAGARFFAIGIGHSVDRKFLQILAAHHQGKAHFVSAEGDLDEVLRGLFAELTHPVFLPTRRADLTGATWIDGRVCAEGSIGECK